MDATLQTIIEAALQQGMLHATDRERAEPPVSWRIKWSSLAPSRIWVDMTD